MLDSDDFELSDAIKSQYLVRRKEELSRFKTMSDIQKIEYAQHIGHKIAGTAKSFGFEELEPLAREMEHLKNLEFEKCLNLIISFEKMISKYK